MVKVAKPVNEEVPLRLAETPVSAPTVVALKMEFPAVLVKPPEKTESPVCVLVPETLRDVCVVAPKVVAAAVLVKPPENVDKPP